MTAVAEDEFMATIRAAAARPIDNSDAVLIERARRARQPRQKQVKVALQEPFDAPITKGDPRDFVSYFVVVEFDDDNRARIISRPKNVPPAFGFSE